MNGIGKLYPKVYTDTVQRAKDGELGSEIKQFFADYPYGAINAEQVTFYKAYKKYPHKCSKCGEKMHIVTDNEVVMCPKCNSPLESTIEFIMWD